MVDVKLLTKKYSADFALNIDSLKVDNAEILALVGANGSGKSTLLKLIDRATEPDSGSVELDCDINNEVYYQPQTPFLLNSSVYENIAMGFAGKKYKLSAGERKDKILYAAETCELTDLLKKHAYTLSGGEKQRLFFSRMLLRCNRLVLLDEPFSAMDIEIARRAENILIDYCKDNNSALILCTHLPLQAMRVCEQMIILNNGKIAEYGKTADIIANPKTDWGKKFISQWRVD